MTFKEYKEKCASRWDGPALRDAIDNWKTWREMHAYLVGAMKLYVRNPTQQDINGKHHNESGTLRDFLWNCQMALQPDRSRLDPLLDFEERYQKVFLKRGLVIYCEYIGDRRHHNDQRIDLFTSV